jgi:hypothetical protein
MHLPTSDMGVQHILTTWPQTRTVFAANGLEAFTDPAYAERVGRFMKLETALKRKGGGARESGGTRAPRSDPDAVAPTHPLRGCTG